MDITLAVHIVAGVVGLVAGYTALAAGKGATLHRKSGMVFVYSMLAVSFFGTLVSAFRDIAPLLNIPAAVLTAYLAFTAWTTVRPLKRGAILADIVGTAVAAVVGLGCLALGIEAVVTGAGPQGMPAFPFFMFGVVGVVAAVYDVRVKRAGGVRGSSRIARHLWRMCFALFIAALSFFIGQADVFPKAIRIRPLLAMPVLLVLLTMVYWLWKVRVRKTFVGMVGAAA